MSTGPSAVLITGVTTPVHVCMVMPSGRSGGVSSDERKTESSLAVLPSEPAARAGW